MATETSSDKPFYLGLCMAGAVSAGSYTAGVIDYLLEALSEWEKRRGQQGVPTHRVLIPVMGGASAGGMTSLIAASSLNNPLTPIDKPTADLMAEHPENKLYHSWVDLTSVDMLSGMLDSSDIKPGEVVSALNSSFIDQIAHRAIQADTTKWQPLPRYIHPSLKVFTTLTNLQGFDYTVDFRTDHPEKAKYHMVTHNDYACFQYAGEDKPASEPGWMPLDLKKNVNTNIAQDAAMATGAFPIGLKSRLLNRDAAYVNSNPWLKDYLKTNPVADGKYETLNVDGGLINNEPFEKVRSVLDGITGQSGKENDDFNTFTSTVLMIEPFPTATQSKISKQQGLLNVVGLTVASVITQMRSKPADIQNAMDDECAGQYLITPSRIIEGAHGNKSIAGEYAIACGALDGFSGFINKEFRVHDYFLGRYNCKIFLRDYFTVPAEALTNNAIFKNGYAATDRDKFKSRVDGSYQIIPVFLDDSGYTFPDFKFKSGSNWPVIGDADIDKFKPAIKKRAQAVVLNIKKPSPVAKAVLWLGCKLAINNMLADGAISKIKSDLVTWKLLPKKPE